jgi:hypothetical protein
LARSRSGRPPVRPVGPAAFLAVTRSVPTECPCPLPHMGAGGEGRSEAVLIAMSVAAFRPATFGGIGLAACTAVNPAARSGFDLDPRCHVRFARQAGGIGFGKPDTAIPCFAMPAMPASSDWRGSVSKWREVAQRMRIEAASPRRIGASVLKPAVVHAIENAAASTITSPSAAKAGLLRPSPRYRSGGLFAAVPAPRQKPQLVVP